MKIVLITGTSRGIGHALAEKFIANGWFVIGTAVSGLNMADSKSFQGYDLDLSSPKSIESFVKLVIDKKIKIDLFINNAAIVTDDFTGDVLIDRLRETIEVNLFGLVNLTEHLLPQISDEGQVFNISSTAGMLGKDLRIFNYPSYKISKAALNMYTRIIAGRVLSKNIFVASIHPGWVKTDMGGAEADISPEEAALHIYDFAVKKKPIKETGLFWFNGEKLQW